MSARSSHTDDQSDEPDAPIPQDLDDILVPDSGTEEVTEDTSGARRSSTEYGFPSDPDTSTSGSGDTSGNGGLREIPNELGLFIPRYSRGPFSEIQHHRGINFERFVLLAICKYENLASAPLRQVLGHNYFSKPWIIAERFKLVGIALTGKSWVHPPRGQLLIHCIDKYPRIEMEFFDNLAVCDACCRQDHRRQQFSRIRIGGKPYNPDTFKPRRERNDGGRGDKPIPFTVASTCFKMATEAHTIRHYLFNRFMKFYTEKFVPTYQSFPDGALDDGTGRINMNILIRRFVDDGVARKMMKDIKRKLEAAQFRRRGHIAPNLANENLGDIPQRDILARLRG